MALPVQPVLPEKLDRRVQPGLPGNKARPELPGLPGLPGNKARPV